MHLLMTSPTSVTYRTATSYHHSNRASCSGVPHNTEADTGHVHTNSIQDTEPPPETLQFLSRGVMPRTRPRKLSRGLTTPRSTPFQNPSIRAGRPGPSVDAVSMRDFHAQYLHPSIQHAPEQQIRYRVVSNIMIIPTEAQDPTQPGTPTYIIYKMPHLTQALHRGKPFTEGKPQAARFPSPYSTLPFLGSLSTLVPPSTSPTDLSNSRRSQHPPPQPIRNRPH
jgi:hypothetical protein